MKLVDVCDAFGELRLPVLSSQRQEVPHLHEGQYVPLPRFLGLEGAAIRGKNHAALQHEVCALLEVAVARCLNLGNTGLPGSGAAFSTIRG